jgi:hypothetical protein
MSTSYFWRGAALAENARTLSTGVISANRLNSMSRGLGEVFSEDLVLQEVPWRGIPREGFPHLLRGPPRRGMLCHRKVHDAPSLVCQHQKHVQDLKPNCPSALARK